VRLAAARSLARLGDDRGADRLLSALALPPLRIGAAETLAALVNADGLAALKEALSDESEETRMRAAVALGKAGDATGINLLKEMVNDPRVELDAAGALAALGNKDYLPALTRAFRLSALRVEAAVATRRLGATVDVSTLHKALVSGDEMSRITAAEAIIVLLDPSAPAELSPSHAASSKGAD